MRSINSVILNDFINRVYVICFRIFHESQQLITAMMDHNVYALLAEICII